jgi:hypothetical protein
MAPSDHSSVFLYLEAMQQYIRIYWEVQYEDRKTPIRENRSYVFKDESRYIIPANTLKCVRRIGSSMAQLQHPEIDLSKGPATFKCQSIFRWFDHQSYNAKRKELVNELVKWGAHVTGANLYNIKLDRELFYHTDIDIVTVTVRYEMEEN